MNAGKSFEQDFKNSIPEEMYFHRIRDPAQSFGDKDNNLRFSLPNPYDMFLFDCGLLFLLELKTTIGTSFSFKGKTPMIKQHQIDELTKASKYKGIIPGFIFNFRNDKINKTYFLHIEKFNEFKNSTDKNSINQSDIIKFQGLEVRGELKRVRTKYFIGEFIKKIQDEGICN